MYTRARKEMANGGKEEVGWKCLPASRGQPLVEGRPWEGAEDIYSI